jgi:hypothetical protein
MTWFPGVTVKAGRTTWFLGASMWRRSEAPAWRRTRMTWRRVRGGGRMVEANVEDAEEERAPAGVWWENDRANI